MAPKFWNGEQEKKGMENFNEERGTGKRERGAGYGKGNRGRRTGDG